MKKDKKKWIPIFGIFMADWPIYHYTTFMVYHIMWIILLAIILSLTNFYFL